MKMTQCQIGRIGLIDHNIIMVDIESGREIGIEHIYEFQHVASELVKPPRQMYSIVNYGEFTFPTKEAREFCERGKVDDDHVLGRALIVHSLGQMILAKHTLKRRKSNIPTRIFTDKIKAKKWVKALRSVNNEYQEVSELC